MPELQPEITSESIIKEGNLSVIIRPSDPQETASLQELNSSATSLSSMGFNIKWMTEEELKNGKGFVAEKTISPALIKRVVMVFKQKKG